MGQTALTPTSSAYTNVGHGEKVGPGDTPARVEDLERGPQRNISSGPLSCVQGRAHKWVSLGQLRKGKSLGRTTLNRNQQARALVSTLVQTLALCPFSSLDLSLLIHKMGPWEGLDQSGGFYPHLFILCLNKGSRSSHF